MKNSPICLIKEEQELAFLRLMIIKNEHVYALAQLQLLEKKCWEKNLFELLPEIIQLILRAIFACKGLDQEEKNTYLKKLELANDLLSTLQKLNYYLYYVLANIEEYQNVIEIVRRKIKKLKSYPRFTMFYHFLAFGSGVYLEDLVKKTSNAMSRHLNQLNKLKEEYPNMPITDLEPYHREKMEINFAMKEAMFWHYKKNPKKSYQAISRRKAILKTSPELYPKLSEAELHNLIYFCINAEQYDDALGYVGALEAFQAANPSDQIDSPYFIYQMVIYTALFPGTKNAEPYELVVKIKEFLEGSDVESAWIYESLSEYCIIYGFYEDAQVLLNHPQTILFLEKYRLKNYTQNLLDCVVNKKIKDLVILANLLDKLYKESDSSKYVFHYKGLYKIAMYFLKK